MWNWFYDNAICTPKSLRGLAGRWQYILRQLLLGGLIWRGEDGHAVRKGCFRLFSYTLLIYWVGDTSFDSLSCQHTNSLPLSPSRFSK
ncbi:hypothetical protein P8452_34316 [Trifolium repens]|nr:hypothetical protein P8452_34316 [Trifolium repens]